VCTTYFIDGFINAISRSRNRKLNFPTTQQQRKETKQQSAKEITIGKGTTTQDEE